MTAERETDRPRSPAAGRRPPTGAPQDAEGVRAAEDAHV